MGFIGSYLVKKGIEKKYRVINIDKKNYSGINLNIKSKRYQFKRMSICDVNKIKQIFSEFKPDYVINCAAETHVDRSIDKPSTFFETNLFGTTNLLDQVIKLKKCRFIQISTDEVFGSLKPYEKKFTENTNYDPKSPYSASKAAADHAVRSYGNTYGLNYVITNCSNNYGPYQYPEKLIPIIINSLNNKSEIPIYGDGKNIRDWIHVQDHVDAIYKCMVNGKTNNTYLIGANNEISNLNLTLKIIKIYKNLFKDDFNYYNKIKFVKDRKGHDFRYSISAKKIRKDINWKPKINFENGLKETIKFYFMHRKKYNKIFLADRWLNKKYR